MYNFGVWYHNDTLPYKQHLMSDSQETILLQLINIFVKK